MKFVFVFLVCVLKIGAQEVLLDGTIYDHETKRPIPFVHVSILNTLKGATTDEKGYFFMDVPATYLEKNVQLSTLGYADTVVALNEVIGEKPFGMVKDHQTIDNLVVGKPSGELEVLHAIASSDLEGGISSATAPRILATYFPNTDPKRKYINKVTVFLKKEGNLKRPVSKFRIRVYDVDTLSQKPAKDLLHKSTVLDVVAESDFVTVDLSDFNIEMPSHGVYIGLEWLFVPYNWYAVKGKDPVDHKLTIENGFAPSFGGINNKNQNTKVMVYEMGAWVDFQGTLKKNEQALIPAVSLSLFKEK